MILNILFVLILANAYMSVQIRNAGGGGVLVYNLRNVYKLDYYCCSGLDQDISLWQLNGDLNSGWWKLKTNEWNYTAHYDDGPWGTITHDSFYLSADAKQNAGLTVNRDFYNGVSIGLTYVKIPKTEDGREYGFHIKKNIKNQMKCLQKYKTWWNIINGRAVWDLSFDDCRMNQDCATGQNCALGEKVWRPEEVWFLRDDLKEDNWRNF